MRVTRRSDRVGHLGAQGGYALTEVLVSIVLIGALVGALSAGIITTLRSSSAANVGARASVLLTSFEESLQQISYRSCADGDLETLYTNDFVQYENELPPHRRVEVPGADARIVDVSSGCESGPVDTGEQDIQVELTFDGRTRVGHVVKRDPEPPGTLHAEYVTPVTQLTNPGDPVTVFSLDPSPSFSTLPIAQYTWDCGDGSDPTVKPSDDPLGTCSYPASTTDQIFTITLIVTNATGEQDSFSSDVTVLAQASGLAPPQVTIVATPSSGNAPLLVDFTANATALDGRTIVRYEWDFGDPGSGSANESDLASPSHVYAPGGTGYTVRVARVTVWDSFGLSATDVQSIPVVVPGPTLPNPNFSVSPGQLVVAPQTITFDAGASSGVGGISAYEWDFGDGTTGTGQTVTHTYTTAGTYTVTLDVEAGNGGEASTDRQIVVGSVEYPTSWDFRLTGATTTGAFDFGKAGHLYFAWTNLPASPGDRYEYDIEVTANTGWCVAFGSESRTVVGGAPGTTQTYDFVVDPPWYLLSFVCGGQSYTYRVAEVRRISPTDGTTTLGPRPNVTVTL